MHFMRIIMSLSSSPILEIEIPYDVAKVLFYSCISEVKSVTPSDNCYIRVQYPQPKIAIKAEVILKDKSKFILPETLQNILALLNDTRFQINHSKLTDDWSDMGLKQEGYYNSNPSTRNVTYMYMEKLKPTDPKVTNSQSNDLHYAHSYHFNQLVKSLLSCSTFIVMTPQSSRDEYHFEKCNDGKTKAYTMKISRSHAFPLPKLIRIPISDETTSHMLNNTLLFDNRAPDLHIFTPRIMAVKPLYSSFSQKDFEFNDASNNTLYSKAYIYIIPIQWLDIHKDCKNPIEKLAGSTFNDAVFSQAHPEGKGITVDIEALRAVALWANQTITHFLELYRLSKWAELLTDRFKQASSAKPSETHDLKPQLSSDMEHMKINSVTPLTETSSEINKADKDVVFPEQKQVSESPTI